MLIALLRQLQECPKSGNCCISAFDMVSQVVKSLNTKAGAILNFIKGGNIDLSTAKFTGGTFQNLISHYGKFKATEELERFARKNSLSLVELNLGACPRID